MVGHYGDETYAVPIDVVEIGLPTARFHTAPVEVSSRIGVRADTPRGCVSWVLPTPSPGRVVTAEHVVGFGGGATPVFAAGGAEIGQVVARAYDDKQLDAALIEVSPDTTLSWTLPGIRTLGDVRYADADDVSDGASTAYAYVPVSRTFVDVIIRQVHVRGAFDFVDETGQTRTPQALILTDPCTARGDSGTALFARDGRPIGLLTGLVRSPAGRAWDAFTEFGPALDALGVEFRP
jgi:S1-C subfamily serine protease